MKTKLNFLMIISLVAILAFTTTTAAAVGITIGPDTLPAAEYTSQYSQQLTADGGTAPYHFTLVSGTLPSNISLSESGVLSGYAEGRTLANPGTYPITVQVEDANSVKATRDYNFVLDKGTQIVDLYAPYNLYWNRPFDLYAEVKMDSGLGYYSLIPGTVAFSIDGNLVPGCDAVPYLDFGYSCKGVSTLLSVGTHTVSLDYTPTTEYADYYTSVSASKEFAVQTSYYYIMGTLFRDNDQDGEYDVDESALGKGFTVNLDQGCDGSVDFTTVADAGWGFYRFTAIPGGFTYCLSVMADPGYQQTTKSNSFYLSTNLDSLNVGFYYPTITISPVEIPSGNVGVEYSQTFTASGGTEPYTFTVDEGTLPDGLTLSSAGVLSGTPTTAGNYFINVQAEDATHAVGVLGYLLDMKIDGVFTFTASPNPSAPGDPVTFTVSATGDAVTSNFGQVAPLGDITFYADGTAIEGCSNLLLNLALDEFGNLVLGNNPAVCTTAALGTGSHQISAELNEYTGLYNTPVLALTQEVHVLTSADLSLSLVDSKDPVKPGVKMVYTLKISNAGPDPALNTIVVDTLDRDTTYISTSAPKGWTCTYAHSKVTCTSASLASGDSAVIKISVLVAKSAPVGKNLINNGNVTSLTFDPDLVNNSVVQKTMVRK